MSWLRSSGLPSVTNWIGVGLPPVVGFGDTGNVVGCGSEGTKTRHGKGLERNGSRWRHRPTRTTTRGVDGVAKDFGRNRSKRGQGGHPRRGGLTGEEGKIPRWPLGSVVGVERFHFRQVRRQPIQGSNTLLQYTLTDCLSLRSPWSTIHDGSHSLFQQFSRLFVLHVSKEGLGRLFTVF